MFWLISDNTGLYIENTARVETSNVVDATITHDSAIIEGVITNSNDKITGAGFYYIELDTEPPGDGSGNDVQVTTYKNGDSNFTQTISALTPD